MTWSTVAMPRCCEDRLQVGNAGLDNVEIGQPPEPLAQADAAKSGSRSITTTRQSGRARSAITRVIGPVPAPSSRIAVARSQSILRTVVPRQPAARRGDARDGRPVLEELAEKEGEVVHRPADRSTIHILTGSARMAQKPRGFQIRRDHLELITQVARNQLVDQAGFLDLGRVAAFGNDHLAHPQDPLGRPNRAGDV